MKDTYTYRFDKLVRDETVPGYERDDTVVAVNWRRLNEMEYRRALITKIHEEADEIPLLEEMSGDIISEIADLQDVIDALKQSYGISDDTIAEASRKKANRRGGFTSRHHIDTITVTPSSEWRTYCLNEPTRYPEVLDGAEVEKESTLHIPKGVYRHPKTGRLYEVLGIVYHTETGDQTVLYRPLYESEYEFYTRPYGMFTEQVIVDGVNVQRFQLLENGEEDI